MFKFKTKFLTTLIVTTGIFSTFALATTPAAPGPYIGASDINCTTVRINFNDNSDDEKGFFIVGDINMTLGENNDSEVYVDIPDLDCNKTYSIQAIAYNDDGNSTPSDIRSFNKHTTFGCDCPSEKPAAPGPYVGATDLNCTAVRINFLDNSNNENGFRITGDINITIPANDETIDPNVYKNLTNLECDKVYQIQIVAFNGAGDSLPSDTGAFNIHTTFGVDCTNCSPVGNIVPPNAPGSYIGVTDINQTAVRLSFLDNSDNEDGFIIYGNDINDTIGENNETENPYVYHNLTGLTCDKLYHVEAVAFNGAGKSAPADLTYFNIHKTFGVDCD